MKPHLQIVGRDKPGSKAAACCPSCQAPAQGDFCARCGESITVHFPTAGEFIHEFVGHYVALEGKLWSTLRLLLFKPGQLTAQFLRGRRVPTINPLRLYLTLSLVMFALIKLNGVDLPQLTVDETSVTASYQHTAPDPAAPQKNATLTLTITGKETIEPGERHTVAETIRLLGTLNDAWAKNARRFMNAPPAQRADILNQGFLSNLPYMLIGALPLFALYLKLLHWGSGRRYGEHLVFALHVSAFVFLLASVMILIPGNLGWLIVCLYQPYYRMISPWDWVQLLPALWIVAYLPAAMRAVYGGARWAAWGKSLLLMSVHLLVIACLIIGAQLIAILRHG